METFYRVHWSDCPPLTAENAWSALWGMTRTPDGSQTVCLGCDGSGEGVRECPRCHGACYDGGRTCPRCEGDGAVAQCEGCKGEGAIDCVRGYSCMRTPEGLIEYFREHAAVDDGEQVVVFAGQEQDTGFDGEPTAVPEHIIETHTWRDFLARHPQESAA